jgi:cytochrome c
MIKMLSVVAALAVCSAGSAPAEDIAAGRTSFKKCLPCHSVGEGAKKRFGPQLNGLDGRDSGAAGGYNYSGGYKNSGIVWNETHFTEYINDPKAKIPGSKRRFIGVKNENEAKNLWAYLSQFSADGSKK